MKAYLEVIIEQRRRDPQDDLISELVQAEAATGCRRMSCLVCAWRCWWAATPIAHLIGNAILTLSAIRRRCSPAAQPRADRVPPPKR
ncbi:MAG: hypothetical protein R2911_36285 [Caldilineaceae bacterium]